MITIVTFANQSGPLQLTDLDNNFGAIANIINQRNTYVPVWSTVVGPQPAIGNGSISGEWVRNANIVTATINATFGTTTTYGPGGAWSFSLPFSTVSALNVYGPAFFGSTGGANLTSGAAAILVGNVNKINLRFSGTSFVGGATFGWAAGGFVHATITFEISQ